MSSLWFSWFTYWLSILRWKNNLLKDIRAINGNNVKGNDNDNTTTVIFVAGDDRGVYAGDNNDNDVANDNNNNDDGKNNDKNNNDNDIYDDKQTYGNEDFCAICQNKFVDTTPENLSILNCEEQTGLISFLYNP